MLLKKTRRMLQAEEILAQQEIHLPVEQYITQQLNAGARFRSIAKTLRISQGALTYWCAKMGIQKQYTSGYADGHQQ